MVLKVKQLKDASKPDHAIGPPPDDPSMQLDWIKRQGKKATPLFVHLLMIVSVGAYAIFGAVVMRKLESKTVAEVRAEIEKRHAEDMQLDSDTFAKALEVGLKHRRRRRHNDTDVFEKLIKDTDLNLLSNREKRAAAQVMRSRRCVITAIKKLAGLECSASTLNLKLVRELDKCYHVAVEQDTHNSDVIFTNSKEEVETVVEEHEVIEPWSFMDSLLFAFTVITTIGYGNVAPKTFAGRLFVIIYGLVGIPFTLLAIADLGKFLSEIMLVWTQRLNKLRKKMIDGWRTRRKLKGYETKKENGKAMLPKSGSLDDIVSIEEGKNNEEGSVQQDESDEMDNSQALALFIVFILYIGIGGVMLAAYEPDMDFFKAVYFNFVTLTSIGLGDIVPRSETYMVLTIIYISIGLALTTMAIEIAADTLKKLHYYGRKIENVGNVAIWFGGKKISMKALVKNLGDQFNLPTTVIKDLDLDNFVDLAIKVEEGEIETLRPPPFEPDPEEFTGNFMDDAGEDDQWVQEPTPSPSPEPEPEPPKTPTPPPREPTPEPTPVPTPEPPKEPTPEPSPIPSPEPPREPTPPPPTPPPKTPTPPPRSPTPEPVREPTPEPPREPTPPPPPEKPRQLTAAELAAQKRRAYSEEAWRRYQEYQKQWKKFRQTQKVPTAGTGTGTSTRSGSGPSSSKNSTQPGTPEAK